MAQAKKQNERKFNPRLISYLILSAVSIINLSAVANVENDAPYHSFRGIYELNLVVGIFSFALSFLVTVIDLIVSSLPVASHSTVEGSLLFFLLIVWLVGVGSMTQIGGIAYRSMNIYASSWLSLFATARCLNQWSGQQDILTFQEMTGVSATLKGWYILLGSSLVGLGTSVHGSLLLQDHTQKEAASDDFAIAIAFSGASTIMALIWITSHYKFLPFEYGTIYELVCSFFCICGWIIVTAIVTEESGIAPTICGSRHAEFVSDTTVLEFETCRISWTDEREIERWLPCGNYELAGARGNPGSNLYLVCWISLVASIYIPFRWKAQQALQFAQTAQENQRIHAEDDEANSDLDEFQDANDY